MRKVLINASNLHNGGGVQVATSFIYEMTRVSRKFDGLFVVVSSEVARGLELQDAQLDCFEGFEVVDVYGFGGEWRALRRLMKGCEVVFTIFGPLYRWWMPFKSVEGFAQPWIIYPYNECWSSIGRFEEFKLKIKFFLQALYFRRADELVVELEHVREGVIREMDFSRDSVYVVNNCLSSIYLDRTTWNAIEAPMDDCCLKLGFLGRNYPHKNTKIFPEVVDFLAAKYGISAKFYVTFNDAEWSLCSEDFKRACVNVGPLEVTQCPDFYAKLDAVVFPSLLECFSATPLEAMAMEKPLFVSDRDFNRDVCGNFAYYFDPLSSEKTAEVIAEASFAGFGGREKLLNARSHAFGFSSARGRALDYLSIIGF